MTRRWWMPACLALLVTSWVPASDLQLEPFLDGLSAPLYLTHAGDGSGRIFILERAGRIRIHDGQQLLPTSFLDITQEVDTSGEGGLLGLAFHPNFSSNRRFFINYTRTFQGQFQSVIAEYQASPGNPDIADPNGQILLTYDQPRLNHDAGWLGFGPDGYLYIAVGDGGGAGDPDANGQNINTLLGSILRIDVDSGTPYGIPPTNPFVGQPGADEIYAYGFRNPWRASFDRSTGRLFVGDVGQNRFEEVDIVAAGGNYGWNIVEGNSCYPPGANCDTSAFMTPIHVYDHGDGNSITGGYVYRGPAATDHQGDYIFGDYGHGTLWSLRETSPGIWQRTFEASLQQLASFGEDEEGNLYAVSLAGSVMRIRFGSGAAVADLSLNKVSQQINPPVGTNLNYTLTVSNSGPDPAESLTLTDDLPGSLLLQGTGSSTASCSRNGNLVTCNLQQLGVGSSVVVNITAKVLQGGPIVNSATVNSMTEDPDLDNNSDSVTVQAQPTSADLQLTKTADAVAPTPGSLVTFTLSLENLGPAEASDVSLTDPLPAGFEFESVQSDALNCEFSGGTVTCTANSLDAFETTQVQVAGRVTAAGPLTNQATATFDGNDPNLENNDAEASFTVLAASDVMISKSLRSGLFPGEKAVYEILVRNQGDLPSQSPLTLTDALPAPLTFLSSDAPGWDCDVAENSQFTCLRDTPLEAGEENRVEIRVLVGAGQGEVTNTATLVVSGDADESNNSSSATDTLLALEELPLTFSQLALGGGFELVLLVSNRSTSSWQGVAELREGNDLSWSTPWTLDEAPQEGSSQFGIQLEPHASRKFVLGGDETARAGFLRITPDAEISSRDVAVSFFYRLSSEGELDDSIATPVSLPGRVFEFPVEKDGQISNTGFAWAPLEGGNSFTVRLHVYADSGQLLQSVDLDFDGHADYLIDEVLDLPENFQGLLVMESPQLVYLTVLRLDSGRSLQLTSVQPRTVP